MTVITHVIRPRFAYNRVNGWSLQYFSVDDKKKNDDLTLFDVLPRRM